MHSVSISPSAKCHSLSQQSIYSLINYKINKQFIQNDLFMYSRNQTASVQTMYNLMYLDDVQKEEKKSTSLFR